MTPKIGDSTIAGAVNTVMIHESWASLMPKGSAERRQRRLDEIHAHHQRDARGVDDAQGARLCRRELFHAEQSCYRSHRRTVRESVWQSISVLSSE